MSPSLHPLVFVVDAVGWYSVSCKFSVESEVIIGLQGGGGRTDLFMEVSHTYHYL
jgi:hypothetical protein